MRMVTTLMLVALSTIGWSPSLGAEGAITILNQASSHFTVTVTSPCLQYKVVHKEPVDYVEEFVNVRGCRRNFAEFTIAATRRSVPVDVEDGSYVVIDDCPTPMATLSGYLVDAASHAVLSSLFLNSVTIETTTGEIGYGAKLGCSWTDSERTRMTSFHCR